MSVPSGHDGETDRAEEARQIRSLWAAIATSIAVIIAAIAFLFIRGHTPGSTAPSTSLTGSIVYAVPNAPGYSRLWIWRLSTGLVEQGPLVHTVEQLVNASGAGSEWLGVTSRLGSGRLRASVVDLLDPQPSAEPLIGGDLISWDVQGNQVVAGERPRAHGKCVRHIEIVYRNVKSRDQQVQFDREFCGDLLSLVRVPYWTYATFFRGRSDVVAIGDGLKSTTLRRFALLGGSSAASLLVVPENDLRLSMARNVRAETESAPTLSGAAWLYRGRGSSPIPYRDAKRPLIIERILALSIGADRALVVGRVGDQAGMFQIDTGPSDDPDERSREPLFIGEVDEPTYATFTSDGAAVVLSGHDLYELRDGRLTPLEFPIAPTPTGPIVWFR